MSSTNFTTGTVIQSSWLNDVNNGIYNTLAPKNSPTFITPSLGVAAATSINKNSFVTPTTGCTWSLADGRTFTVSNTLTLTGTDGASLALGPGANTVSGANTGDQLIFKTVSVAGQSDVVADTTSDTLTLVAGSGITLTTDAVADSVTIALGASATPSLTLLGTVNVTSSVTNIDFLNTFTSNCDKYIVEFEGLITTSPGAVSLFVYLASAGSILTSTVYYGPAAHGAISASTGLFNTNVQTSTTLAATGTMEIRNTNSTTQSKGFGIRAANTTSSYIAEGVYAGTQVISGLRLISSGGANFTAGTVRVYGVRNT